MKFAKFLQEFDLKDHHIVFLLVVVAALMRWLPHPHNIAPIGALALFSGAYLHRRVFWLVPLVALLLGDAINGFYNLIVLVAVYAGFLASTLIGRRVLFQNVRLPRIAVSVGLGALAFWVISNFGSWLAFRPLTIEGLIACYVDALAYLGRSLIGDSLYTVLIFGVYHVLQARMRPRLAN